MLAKYIAPVVAVLGLASAQTSSSLCSQATATIASQADATALAASCTTLSGALAIASSAAGAIDISGIEKISGSFSCTGATNLTGITGNQLTSIGGDFILNGLTIMSTLSFPVLTTVKTIQWQTLNQLQELSFTTGISSASSLIISDTQLTSLDGINLMTVTNMNINNNFYLRSYSTQLRNITGLLQMSANGPNLTVEFPNLSTVNNMTIANVTSLTIPSLAKVSGNMGFYSNYFESIMAPNLTTVGDLTFQANPYLTNISMPNLATITAGALFIANNTDLTTIDGFGSLKSTGAISISGNFTSVSLPSLSDDKGALYLVSSGNFDCSPFTSLSTQIVKGKITCDSGSTNVQSGGSSGTSGSSSSSTSTSKAAAAGIKVDTSAMFGAFSLAAIFTVIGGAAGVAQLVL